ncbi:conjugal transfer protein TraL [Vibrio parahaemolyticus]|uniref:conjugal transfer protein TraL n=1 Tax=Vibrio parahaemolyticus TaxID=670 RepID=UPI001E60CE2E|nr:conjugal transfer protein TraL [Vibrio parahaemolyticus]
MNLTSVCAVGAVVALGVMGTLAPTPAQAASQDECAIWICLPGGFPSGCGAAKSALKKRIKKFKPPLPAFSSCMVSSGSNSSQMSYNHNFAALIAEQRICKRWGGRDDNRCVGGWEVIPQHYQKGTRCRRDRDGYRSPRGCIATKRYVDVYVDGQAAGPTYYW